MLFHLFVQTSSKITILLLLCTNPAVNMTKVMIKTLQGSAVTQTMQDGSIYCVLLKIFC